MIAASKAELQASLWTRSCFLTVFVTVAAATFTAGAAATRPRILLPPAGLLVLLALVAVANHVTSN